MPKDTVIIEVKYQVTIPENVFQRLLAYAINNGFAYGDDPGNKEILRRMFIDDGVVQSMFELDPSEDRLGVSRIR